MQKNTDPRMHTAEHILNRTMVNLFGCGRAVNAHIEDKKSKCDYRFAKDLTAEEVATIEAGVNAVILRNLPVTEVFLPREEAAQAYNLGKVPQDAGDSIRIVRVGDYDECPCIGRHVKTTAEIGTFSIVSHSYGEGLLRIRFRVG